MPRAISLSPLLLAALLGVLMLALTASALLWNRLNALEQTAHALHLHSYLLECVQAVEQARDNVTEQIAPLEGKACTDPLLKFRPSSLAHPATSPTPRSEIAVDRTLEPYSRGEYTVVLRLENGSSLRLTRGQTLRETPAP